jgi:hypothetical protein
MTDRAETGSPENRSLCSANSTRRRPLDVAGARRPAVHVLLERGNVTGLSLACSIIQTQKYPYI